jgi:hypothetical protein
MGGGSLSMVEALVIPQPERRFRIGLRRVTPPRRLHRFDTSQHQPQPCTHCDDCPGRALTSISYAAFCPARCRASNVNL